MPFPVDAPVLLAVAHGTAERSGIVTLDALMERVRALAPGLRVELAYVDHEPPSVSSALSTLARSGASVVTVPLLLVAASHSKGDIAGAIRVARSSWPSFSVAYGRPLSPSADLLDVVVERLAAAGADADTAVLLVSAGSADPDANAEMFATARVLWERRGGRAPVEVAFASAAAPNVVEGLARLRLLGHSAVVVAPYFLAPGKFIAAVGRDAAAHGAAVAGVLGAHDGVARAVLTRYREALGGDVLMNCDTCVYRAAMPGRETRVGMPQRPHSHPYD